MAETILNLFRGAVGVAVIIGVCCLVSVDRKNINWKMVWSGILLQLLVALLVLKIPIVGTGFEKISTFFVLILQFATEGSRFVFGSLVDDTTIAAKFGFKVLPSIIFFSALTSVLYYLGILQRIVFLFAWVMNRTMRLSGSESMAAAANVFIGQTEAPLLIRPYLERMTPSEITCLMTGGMATIAGSVLAAYISILGGTDPAEQVLVGKRLITASIMAAPAAITLAKILYPETDRIDSDLKVSKESIGVNLFDAIASGTTQGVKLAVNVGAVLIVFIALIDMLNFIAFNGIGSWTGLNAAIQVSTHGAYAGFTLEFLFGVLFAPVAFIAGVDPGSLLIVGQLLGEKLVLNEFIAYFSMAGKISEGILIDQKAIVISTFALCGFANFASVGVQIGGISTLAPGQRTNLARLALRALLGGALATLMTGTVAGALF